MYKKTEIRYFSAHSEQARLIKSLLYGIYWHLLAKKQERHDLKCILVAWYTFGRRKQKKWENNGPLKALLSQSQSAISPEMMIIISNNTVSRVQFGKTYTREFFNVFKSHSHFKLVQYRSSLKNSLVHVVFKLHSERYKCPYQQL